jgi:L-ascorbate metabolism protein UlaG (beta-lactamase superfamily)
VTHPARTPFPPSDHCDGRRFFNPGEHINRTWFDVLRWKLTSRPAPWPGAVEIAPPSPPVVPPGGGFIATWVNHASFLLRSAGLNLLVDPVWCARAGPFGLTGPRRVHPPGVAFEALPAIDAILLSHDHYDHCDLATLRRLARRHPQARLVTPLGNGDLARRAGFVSGRIVELDWWDSFSLGNGRSVRLTPARHWSNRLHGLRNRRLWGGFRVDFGGASFHFAGDTGYDAAMFREIRARCGPPDLAALPIGAYEPRWFMAPQHCNPAEAVRLHLDLGAQASVAMHWGTFPLTDEGRLEPPAALADALVAAGLPPGSFRVLQPGESVVVTPASAT